MNTMGTTPPSGDIAANHPSLLSCHSYPGAAGGLPLPCSCSCYLHSAYFSNWSGITAVQWEFITPTQQTPPTSGRPPQSPSLNMRPTMSSDVSKHLQFQSEANKEEQCQSDPSALPPLAFKRDRGYTISVMSPVRKPHIDWTSAKHDNSPRSKDAPHSGINPSFVFLQLYHTTHFGSSSEKPLLVSQSQVVQRAVKNLDRIPPYETHKVGVIYVGPGQASSETKILQNQFGSVRYTEFLQCFQRLGTLIKLKDAEPQNIFLGGLDRHGNDGKSAYIWQDDVMQVTFHVATLMPTKQSDPSCNGKKLHIGNDYVTVAYNDSGEDYNIETVKGQFNYACVIIQPLDHCTNQVIVKTREELAEHIGHSDPKIVSDQNVAILARQLALHANLASVVSCSLKAQGRDPYASNWLERLRQIKHLRSKVFQETATATSDNSSISNETLTSPRSSKRVHMDDFTEYT